MVERDLALANREGRLDDYLQVIRPAQPAVSVSTLTFTPPGGEVWRPVLLTFTYTSSAVLGSRGALLSIADGVGTLAQAQLAASQPVNTTARYTWAAGIGASGAQATPFTATGPLFDLPLLAGWSLNVAMFNNGAGDQFNNVALTVEKLDEGALGQYGGLALDEQLRAAVWDAAQG